MNMQRKTPKKARERYQKQKINVELSHREEMHLTAEYIPSLSNQTTD